MKVIKENEYAALKQKADNYDAVVAAVVAKNPDISTEEISVETVTEIIKSSSENHPDAGIQAQLDKANADLKVANTRISELETENANLLSSAGDQSGTVKTKKEVTSEEKTLADFANENAGDTASILEKCKKDGLI
ncbi:MAG: hypothetical protein LBC40_05910 [Dysgonamonadaceae bacterium]|jgi:hypothetical protein|nr:hypothetical protein [Dysgonamonadaceae bacterium]